nr:TPA_asm: NADH dehydrogenase subunit 6 [Microgale fotsifotsy]
MKFLLFLMSVAFVVSFVGFSSKPSPIYGGLGLIVGGGVGCGIVLSFGGTFLGLMVFLVYLGGMLVVFGYTTAMATEEYPEVWVSNMGVLCSLFLGLLVEVLLMVLMLKYGSFAWGLESLVLFGSDSMGLIRGDYMGGAMLYDQGCYMMAMAAWCLFVSIFIVMEVTRGR